MSKLGKLLLVITSLAPVLGAYAVNSAVHGQKQHAVIYLAVGVGLSMICLLLLFACKTQLAREPLKVVKVAVADKKPLAFLLAYLLPLLTKGTFELSMDWMTSAYVFIIVGVVIFHSNYFTFNPVLSLRGYHFYEVESATGMSYLFMTKKVIRRQDNEFVVVAVSDYVYLDVE
jgi:hypothetical protein